MNPKPMKLTDVSLDETERLIHDNSWVFEQKMDGVRVMAVVRIQTGPVLYDIEWLASGGGALKFAAAAQHLEKIGEEIRAQLKGSGITYVVLDGELMIEDGEYRLFDMPILERFTIVHVSPDLGYLLRRATLDTVIRESDVLKLSRIAYGPTEKRELWESINAAGVEGAVAKHRGSPYLYGLRSKEQVKLKLVKTADVIVTEITNWTGTTGSADLGVMIDPKDDPQPYANAGGRRIDEPAYFGLSETRRRPFRKEPRSVLPVGSASLIGKDRSIEVGSVVEINYLYWTGKAAIQPRIMRKRRDEEKLAADCTLAQFPTYSRKAV